MFLVGLCDLWRIDFVLLRVCDLFITCGEFAIVLVCLWAGVLMFCLFILGLLVCRLLV